MSMEGGMTLRGGSPMQPSQNLSVPEILAQKKELECIQLFLGRFVNPRIPVRDVTNFDKQMQSLRTISIHASLYGM